ncbi:MAG: hypothetical protein ACI97P_000743 [Arcticibacterium sp.]|jgi:hypothetical protein
MATILKSYIIVYEVSLEGSRPSQSKTPQLFYTIAAGFLIANLGNMLKW